MMNEWFRVKMHKRKKRIREMSATIPGGIFRTMKSNTKSSINTFRKIQDGLRKQFPGMVDKDWMKKL